VGVKEEGKRKRKRRRRRKRRRKRKRWGYFHTALFMPNESNKIGKRERGIREQEKGEGGGDKAKPYFQERFALFRPRTSRGVLAAEFTVRVSWICRADPDWIGALGCVGLGEEDVHELGGGIYSQGWCCFCNLRRVKEGT
jgi:hypothetical protein